MNASNRWIMCRGDGFLREAHSYEYDNNGNILYVNTSRVKPDMTVQPDTVQRAREERFRWDEENRLTALSQNGYVSHYWYDANGERTVKMHGGNQAVFVNNRQDAPVGRGASRAVREEIQRPGIVCHEATHARRARLEP